MSAAGDFAGAGADLHASDAAKTGRRWQLYNFVYLVAILAPIHYLWSVKIVSPQPVIYACCRAFEHGVTRSSASGGDNSVMCSFPQILYQPRLFFG
jgi:hypothetical protein